MGRWHRCCARGLGAALLGIAVSAAPSSARADVIDEVKAGILAHDVGLLGNNTESGADIVGEVLFTSPSFMHAIGAPRPALGVSVNTDSHTDYAYADLDWTAIVWRPASAPQQGLYLGGFLGGAVHDGHLNHGTPTDKAFGTRLLFHLGVEIGYQITPAYSIEAYFAHLSNADLSSRNPGLNNIGIRVGFRF